MQSIINQYDIRNIHGGLDKTFSVLSSHEPKVGDLKGAANIVP